ncbi:hypothetical protein I302_106371 [Kwoniella bestiolae CBS 10118]|uniref:Spt20-like SEP domain-containing protein n=1 Tax=Kwoniella bestiolae CBS 10118 TaxID=1296100 RepID=A0A1B9G3T7_9TREE|nr:hypothetical protein I302_05494 [Kwoniella bestiolae CBS 10118]OCF25670.1 hypothetical protein I302_05494 [Kwoniella bestiolae CBS 10118]
MASASGYNHHRFARAVLKKSRKWEPSLTVQLYQGYWRFENSPINFQYDGEMKPFLLALRSQVIPSSLIRSLYNIHPPISFVDGCLVVEIQDFRRSPETRSRVVMRPAAETLAQTIDVMLERKGQNLDEGMGLELESRIIAATSPPLYLGTSILATRNATLALALTSPANPNLSSDGSPRPSSALNDGSTTDSKSTLDKMRKLLRAGINDRSASSSSGAVNQFQPNWTVLRAKEQYERLKMQREIEAREAASRASAGMGMGGDPNTTMMGGGGEGDEAANGEGGGTGEKKKVKKKRAAPAPVEEEEEQKEVKKPKKKKKLNNAAAEAEAKAEDTPVPAKKKKNAQKDATQNEVPPPKKKVQKKKKDDGEKTKNDAAGEAGAGAGTSGS